tara:strand:+ start:275 stop:1024 length:750 start_codon:yes stop_codon:yes gene_type:complete
MTDYVTLTDRLGLLEDTRHPYHITYSLPEALFVVYASILSNYTAWEDMASFATHNQAWFRQFFPYQFGFPSQYTLQKVCSLVDAQAFMQLFVDWMNDVVASISTKQMGPFLEKNDHVIALDGKALKGSRPPKGKKLIHMVSAYSSEQKLILGFSAVDKKSNEITAIPKVLDMLALEGALISSDAMGCQRAICQKILDKGADYLLSVKDNQPTLHANIESVFTEHIEHTPCDNSDEERFAETVEKKQRSL